MNTVTFSVAQCTSFYLHMYCHRDWYKLPKENKSDTGNCKIISISLCCDVLGTGAVGLRVGEEWIPPPSCLGENDPPWLTACQEDNTGSLVTDMLWQKLKSTF